MLDSISNAILYVESKTTLLLFLFIPVAFHMGAYSQCRVRIVYYDNAAVIECKYWWHLVWQPRIVFSPLQTEPGTPAERAVKFIKLLTLSPSPPLILDSQKRAKNYNGPLY